MLSGAKRTRRGQPWQLVAFSLFATGTDLPEETIRAAYYLAFTIEVPADRDQLDAAEYGVGQMLLTTVGCRLERLLTTQVKRSGVAPCEPPSAVAHSVLANLFLLQLGDDVANDEAMIELFAAIGLPIAEQPSSERFQAARLMDAVLGSFFLDELADVAETAPVEELRSAIPMATTLVDTLPAELRKLGPRATVEQLPGLLAPVIIWFFSITAGLQDDQHNAGGPQTSSMA
ncbi:MAG: hypothetical protein ACYDEY_15640 [Acidimicrobiales bacterium]